uniref:Uncharacterized protein n=1 Tax=Astyanax mexicanus TaxID=7994 RepID=W5KUU9_ASTMX
STCGEREGAPLSPQLCCQKYPDLQKLLLHRVLDQIWTEPVLPAGQVISGDGEGQVGGQQGFLQPPLVVLQELRLRLQPLRAALQLRPAGVHVLQPGSQQQRPAALRVLRPRRRLGRERAGGAEDALRVLMVGERALQRGRVVLLPLARGVLGGAEARGGETGGRSHGQLPVRDGGGVEPGREHLRGHFCDVSSGESVRM